MRVLATALALAACLATAAAELNITNTTVGNTTTTTTTTTTTRAPIRPTVQTRGEALVLTSNANVVVEANDVMFTNKEQLDVTPGSGISVSLVTLYNSLLKAHDDIKMLREETDKAIAAEKAAAEAAIAALTKQQQSDVAQLRSELSQANAKVDAQGKALNAAIQKEAAARSQGDASTLSSAKSASTQLYQRNLAAINNNGNRIAVVDRFRQRVVGTSCGSGMVYDFNSDGSVRCRSDRYTRGSCSGDKHVTGVSSSGVVTCSSYAVQRRVSRSCGGGSSIRVISQSGTVSCEKDDVGNTKTRVWSGYCSYHTRGGGWRTYCHNRQDRDSMGSSYLTRSSTGNFNIRSTGMYRLSWFFLAHGCGSKHTRVIINNSQREYRHHTGSCGHCWEVLDGSMIWWFNRGHWFYFSVHGSSCNPYRWHSGNSGGAHSRVQITHEGSL